MERLEAIVAGRVQMVMYRDFAERMARARHLLGEVWNEKDGTVRVIAEGERNALDSFLKKLHHGPLLAHVEHVAASFSSPQGGYEKFSIRYSTS